MASSLEKKVWWRYIHEDVRELLKESLVLLERSAGWRERFHDYAFVVFPAAKAYEGFLKSLFLDLKFITEDDFYGKRFRIGRALNPALDKQYRSQESIYDRIVDYCGDRGLADTLWETWKNGRNLIFHWFPNERNAIDIQEAQARVEGIINAIDVAYNELKISKDIK